MVDTAHEAAASGSKDSPRVASAAHPMNAASWMSVLVTQAWGTSPLRVTWKRSVVNP